MAKKKGRKTYISRCTDILLKSLKFDTKKLLYVMSLDTLFLAVSFGSLLYLISVLNDFSANIEKIYAAQTTDFAALNSGISDMSKFKFLVAFGGMFWVLFLMVLASICAYLVWTKISDAKVSFFKALRFTSVNIFLMLFSFLVLIFFEPQGKSKYASITFLALFVLLALILNTFYVFYARLHFMDSLKKIWMLCKRIYLLFVPLLIFILTFLIVLSVSSLISILLGMINQYVAILGYALLLPYFYWIRTYYYFVLEEITQ